VSCQTDFDDAFEAQLLKQWSALSQRCDRCTQTVTAVAALDVAAWSASVRHTVTTAASGSPQCCGYNADHRLGEKSALSRRPEFTTSGALRATGARDRGLPLGPVSSLLSKPLPSAAERLPRIEDLYHIPTDSGSKQSSHRTLAVVLPDRGDENDISWRPEVSPKHDGSHAQSTKRSKKRHAGDGPSAVDGESPELQQQRMIYFRPTTVNSMPLSDLCTLERRLLRLQKLRGTK
jgi:hypothetical protein